MGKAGMIHFDRAEKVQAKTCSSRAAGNPGMMHVDAAEEVSAKVSSSSQEEKPRLFTDSERTNKTTTMMPTLMHVFN